MFVPGPGDAGPGAVLPRPPLPESLVGELRERLPNAMFASNPCRIRHYTQVHCPFQPCFVVPCLPPTPAASATTPR